MFQENPIKKEFLSALQQKTQIEENNTQIDSCIKECIEKLKKGNTEFSVHVKILNECSIPEYINSRLEREVGNYIKNTIGLENSTTWTGSREGLYVVIYPNLGGSNVNVDYSFKDECEKKSCVVDDSDIDYVKIANDANEKSADTKMEVVSSSN